MARERSTKISNKELSLSLAGMTIWEAAAEEYPFGGMQLSDMKTGHTQILNPKS